MNRNSKEAILNEYLPLNDKVEYLRNKLYGVKGVGYGEEVKSCTNKTIVDNLMELEKYSKRLDYILNAINRLKDESEKTIIKFMYVEGISIADIYKRELMHYSYSNLKRLKSSALDNIEFN